MIALPSLSLRGVVEAGLSAEKPSAWHQNPVNGVWYWHASSLGRCPRAQILDRAGHATDGITTSSLLNFEVGHAWHERMGERWLPTWLKQNPDWSLVVTEVGYYHREMPLAAKPDVVLLHVPTQTYALIDHKTEHEYAIKRRRTEAQKDGWDTAAKWEHRLQMVATAMVLESNDVVPPMTEGRLWYISKNNFFPDEVLVDLSNKTVRNVVGTTVALLELRWRAFEHDQALPGKLTGKDETWQCETRLEADSSGSDDPRGRWCTARSACMDETTWKIPAGEAQGTQKLTAAPALAS